MNHTSAAYALLPKFVAVVHGSFYSYKTATTCSEQCLVESRLSFAVELIASGNWNSNKSFRKLVAPTSLENNF